MVHLSLPKTLNLAREGLRSYITNRAIIVSYEVTLSCNCNCRHCDLGGVIEDEKQIGPEEYADLTRRLRPLIAQISGGEPLLRKDIAAVVKAIKQSDAVPYVILVTNGVLLNESNYLQLREAGVNQFSVSLDFPDERHDEFRRRPGLYRRLERNLPQLAKFGFRDIILNTAITQANMREILPLARKATEWNVAISYSAYTALRTNETAYCINNAEDLKTLRQAINQLTMLKKQGINIVNPDVVLRNTLKFFEQGYMPNCKAGQKFLIIMPDGTLVPCSLHRSKYTSQEEMMRYFCRTNQCGACYVAIRSYSELSLMSHIKSSPMYLRQTISR
jgi:MoaA/NifB/PqqE/SkfB family radical SAM enzyme